ncbi:PA3611 family quorum-sensing-regulated virulence factor, partial [Pseudomonas aeruginosa]
RASHAERMRSNPDSVRSQLGDSVCSNTGYRQLLARGAILTYSFTEYKTNQPVATERFDAGSCRIQGKK